MEHDFDLDLAILLSKLSVRSYREPAKFDEESLGLTVEEYIFVEKTDTHVYILTDDEAIYIAFRGSSSLKDVVNDLMIIKKKYPEVENKFFKPRVHNGFLYTFRSVRDKLFQSLEQLLERKDYKIYFTGHSLGAALAILSAFELKYENNIDATMYNFGCPRIGNKRFVRLYNQTVTNSFRIVNDDDFITSLPKFWYKHVDTLVYIYDKGEISVNPGKVERFFEKADNLIRFFGGDGIIDHLEHNYL